MYKNAVFRRNLSEAFRNRHQPATSKTDLVRPDDGDMQVGRERPSQRRARTAIGGKERGSLTPQMLLHYCRQPRRLRHGRHKAPPASLQRSRSQ